MAKGQKAKVEVEFPSVVIMVATESERESIVKSALEGLGLLGRKDIWVVVTGVGKVQAACSAMMLLSALNALNSERLKDVKIINVGLCGGNKKAFDGELSVQINRVVNNDFDIPCVDDSGLKKEVLFITEEPKSGVVRTCFSQDHACEDDAELPNWDEAMYVDMELFAIAMACSKFDVQCVGLKSVCELVGSDANDESTDLNFEDASADAAKLLGEYLSACTDVLVKR